MGSRLSTEYPIKSSVPLHYFFIETLISTKFVQQGLKVRLSFMRPHSLVQMRRDVDKVRSGCCEISPRTNSHSVLA